MFSLRYFILEQYISKKVREKSRECHNHKPQPFPDPKRKRKPTNLNKHKPNKRTKSTKISSLSSPSEVIAILKGLKKHKNKMTHGKTYNKSPCRINHRATKSKTNTGTTALERSLICLILHKICLKICHCSLYVGFVLRCGVLFIPSCALFLCFVLL